MRSTVRQQVVSTTTTNLTRGTIHANHKIPLASLYSTIAIRTVVPYLGNNILDRLLKSFYCQPSPREQRGEGRWLTTFTQAEADSLLQMPKVKVDDKAWDYPGEGGVICIPLFSTNGKEKFLLDIRRARIAIKGTYQTRGRHVVVLARLDFGGSPHRNPDEEEISCPHLHLYREGYGHKWAYPIPVEYFPSIDDRWQTLQNFMSYCHIVEVPNMIRGLFA